MTFKFNGKTYGIVYNLNVMEEIQKEYGSISKWAAAVMNKRESSIKGLIDGIMYMLNEYAEIENEKKRGIHDGDLIPTLTHKQVARMFSAMGSDKLFDILDKAIDEASEGSGEDEKNE